MSLHVEVMGSGEPLVLLHGWGMHGGAWGEVAATLADSFEVHNVDLPGHGLSSGKRDAGREREERGWEKGEEVAAVLSLRTTGVRPSTFSLDAIVSELSAQFPERVNLLGWSLGGIIAQRWATRDAEKIKRLILVASTPCFAEREDWSCGMPRDTLAKFAAELEQNYAATLRRFISLQLRGSEYERELLASLREQLFSRGEPDMEALRGGLEILREVDQRADVTKLKQPTLLIAGQRDKLTPPEASTYLAQTMPNARMVEMIGAAHAPFLSHPDLFIEHVKKFLHE